jgi:hypothetical protein
LVSLLISTAALAQNQRPLPLEAPEAMPPLARVHVLVRDTLEPDRLRDLARPNVTAWVETSNNTLSVAAVENLARFDEAFVQLRAPLAHVDAAEFARMPRVGPWLEFADLALVGRLPGARRLAVSIKALDEPTVAALTRARPSVVRWTPAAELDVLQWSLFRQVPGHRVVVGATHLLVPQRCTERRGDEAALELHVANLLALSSDAFPCGKGTRVVVPLDVDRWLLQSLLVRDPSVELVLEVGADAERARAARALLDALGVGPSR